MPCGYPHPGCLPVPVHSRIPSEVPLRNVHRYGLALIDIDDSIGSSVTRGMQEEIEGVIVPQEVLSGLIC